MGGSPPREIRRCCTGIERFNRAFTYVFRTIREVREHADTFLQDESHDRPDEGLTNQAQSDFQP